MKKLAATVALAALMFNITACNQQSTEKTTTGKIIKKKKGKYFCTMHPSITSDKPGICPKCGMEMVERDTTDDK